MNPIVKYCEQCSERIEGPNWRVKKNKFCSNKCYREHWIDNSKSFSRKMTEGYKKKLQDKKFICNFCQEEYTPNILNQKYCKLCSPNQAARIKIEWYGISQRDYDRMLEEQNYCCKICETPNPSVIDHCHKTEKVRGILCQGCNVKLAALDNEEWKVKAEKYRKGEL